MTIEYSKLSIKSRGKKEKKALGAYKKKELKELYSHNGVQESIY